MIGRVAIRHYKNLFNMGQTNLDSGTLDYILKLITEEDNDMIHKAPIEDEIKNDVFSMSADSSAGPDGFNGKFFHTCWDIIKYDVCDFVAEFFSGKHSLNISLTHVWLLFLKLSPLLIFLN